MTDTVRYADVRFTRWQATAVFPDCCPYVRGKTYTRQSEATFEFKAGSPDHTGGGYSRWRSYESGAHTPGETKRTAFVPVHRLLAVVACYPSDRPIAAVCADVGAKDVHHQLGMPSANLPEELEVIDHGEHSSVTQAQRRAYAADKKREVEAEEQQRIGRVEYCVQCGDEADAVVSGTDYCLECGMAVAERTGATIEM